MKRTAIAILLFSVVTYGQQRTLAPERRLVPDAPGTVTLTLAEFNRLVELAARKPKVTEPAPLPFILSRAIYKLRIESESVVGTLEIDGEVLHKGPTKVPLVSGLTILDAQQLQKPLPLFQDGSTHTAILNGPGAFSVSMNIAAGLLVDAARASFTVPVPPAGSSMISLDISGSHADLHLEPGLITSRTTSNGHTLIDATLEPGKTARVWWTTREVTAPVTQREARFLSDIKSLISVGDSELRIAALCDITVIQGEPSEFRVPLPSGFEVTEASGSTLDSSENQSGTLVLRVREASRRAHQFLIALERSGRENKFEASFVGFTGAQRETGESLVEGVGTMELTAKEDGGLKRIDVREAGAVVRSLAHFPVQAAFRYHRRPGDSPKLTLEWNQFPDSTVLSAIGERATITTLLNVEGKSLTEVTLRVRNHAQPFVKLVLPQGASLLSAEVEGEKVKPVVGSDGSRVPLLRAGFRPSGAYTVSFVYLASGVSFGKSGKYELVIPKMDVPVSLLTWEVFLPDRLEVKQFGGSALSAGLFPGKMQETFAGDADEYAEMDQSIWAPTNIDIGSLEAGQIGGVVVDPLGAVVSGAVITIVNTQTGASQTARSDGEGRWVSSGVRSGPVRVKVESPGFKPFQQELNFDSSRPARLGTTLEAGSVSEVVSVTAGNEHLERESGKVDQQLRKAQEARVNAPSQNVFSLQRRVAGILPVRVEVPRAGKSYRFVRPLVLEEETKITFQYKSK
jgi:carboxypeptidase family protein